MDLDLLKTFVEVSRTRHFGQAADNLFLTQSAVSARLRLLEQVVGVPLLSRTRGNIQPTPAGNKLLRHAEIILTSWNRARQDIAIVDEEFIPITIGGVPNIWDSGLRDWIHTLNTEMPHIAITADVHGSSEIIQRLNNGTVDVGFLFVSPELKNLTSLLIGEVELIMVSTESEMTSSEALDDRYIMTDWGEAFLNAFSRSYPDAPPPKIRLGLAGLAHDFLLNQGGTAYLASSMVEDDIVNGRLYPVKEAEIFKRTAYAVFSDSAQNINEIRRAVTFLQIDESAVGQSAPDT